MTTTIFYANGTTERVERCVGVITKDNKLFYVAQIGGKTQWLQASSVLRVEVLESE